MPSTTKITHRTPRIAHAMTGAVVTMTVWLSVSASLALGQPGPEVSPPVGGPRGGAPSTHREDPSRDGGIEFWQMVAKFQSIRDELNLTDEQVGEIKAAFRAMFSREGRPSHEELQRLDPEKKLAKISEERDKRFKAFHAKALSILSEQQLERAKQIHLQLRMQMRGAAALGDPEVAEAIGLTPEQIKAIHIFHKDVHDAIRTAVKAHLQNGNRAALHDTITNLRTSMEVKAMESLSLTAEQKAKLTKMQGAKFQFNREEMRRRGMGGSPRRPDSRSRDRNRAGGDQRRPAGDDQNRPTTPSRPSARPQSTR